MSLIRIFGSACLRPQLNLCIAHRCRANFYKPRKANISLPRSIRKFIYQHPKAPVYFVVGLCTIAVSEQFFEGIYMQFMLDPEDYVAYREEHNAVKLNRARYGESLYIPFWSTDLADSTYNFYRRRTLERRAAKAKAAANQEAQS